MALSRMFKGRVRRIQAEGTEVRELEPPFLNGPAPLTDAEFERLRQFIFQQTGIFLSDHKRALVYGRLAKRLRLHGLKSYSDYYQLIVGEGPNGSELVEMINAITTNKTSFFREAHHFTYMQERIFAELRANVARGEPRTLRIWSAGSSTGEEPYTIAMVARDALPSSEGWRIEVLATDIDTNVLGRAENGIYRNDQIDDIPTALLHRYFLRGKGANEGLVKVSPELRALVRFDRLNFNDAHWPVRDTFDVIFCRNVLIYFNKATQRDLVRRLIRYIKPGGYLMLGHSEFLHGNISGLQHLRQNIYKLCGAGT